MKELVIILDNVKCIDVDYENNVCLTNNLFELQDTNDRVKLINDKLLELDKDVLYIHNIRTIEKNSNSYIVTYE